MAASNNIDRLFRERLQGAEVPPPAFVWTNVERELRRRRRRYFLWLWFGLALAGAGGWGLWSAGHPAATSTAARPVPEETTVTGTGSTAIREEDYARTMLETVSAATVPATRNQASDNPGLVDREKSAATFPPPPKRRSQPSLHAAEPTVITSPVPTRSAWSITFQAPPAEVFPLLQPGALSSLLRPAYNLLPETTPALRVLPKAMPFVSKKKAPKKCYDFAQNPRVWLVDAYAGPSWPQRRLTAAQPEFDTYLGQRRSTEQSDWAFNAGLRGSLLFGRHFLLRTGLHYEQMTELFEYADPDFVKVTITQTTKLIDNVLVTVIDTIGVEYGEHYVKTYNRYGRLDVPLQAGVELRSGRAGLSLQGGASLNVYFWKRGTMLNTLGQPESFTPDAGVSPVFRRRAGWSATASAQLFYHLDARVRVFAEPYGSHTLRALTLDGQPIAQRYTTWGLKLGVTKIFD